MPQLIAHFIIITIILNGSFYAMRIIMAVKEEMKVICLFRVRNPWGEADGAFSWQLIYNYEWNSKDKEEDKSSPTSTTSPTNSSLPSGTTQSLKTQAGRSIASSSLITKASIDMKSPTTGQIPPTSTFAKTLRTCEARISTSSSKKRHCFFRWLRRTAKVK